MPKLKQPKTLEDLSIEALGKRVSQKAREAIGSGTLINISGLNDYLYAELPRVLSDKVTTHMLSEVVQSLDCRTTNVNNIYESVILAVTCHDIRYLNFNGLPWVAVKVLPCYMLTFKKLRTLFFESCSLEAVETLPIGLSYLKFLVNFRMCYSCTDAIINTLGLGCSGTIQHIDVKFSKKVTDASFKFLLECHKLKYLSISDTSMTAEGYDQYFKSIQQHEKSGDTAEGFLHVGVGSRDRWPASTRLLNDIAISCPKLKEMGICNLRGDLEVLVSLTTLEVIQFLHCDFRTFNYEGFLRLSGSNIILLDMYETLSIDLRCILNHCVNIKQLYVFGGSTMDMALENIEDAAKALQSLEVLELISYDSSWSMERMLYACVNVKRLKLVPASPNTGNITYEFILRILYHNPLQKLTSFTVFSELLTVNSLNAIIDHCPLLEKLEFFMPNVITDLEIKCLRQRIADKNQDLEIIISSCVSKTHI